MEGFLESQTFIKDSSLSWTDLGSRPRDPEVPCRKPHKGSSHSVSVLVCHVVCVSAPLEKGPTIFTSVRRNAWYSCTRQCNLICHGPCRGRGYCIAESSPPSSRDFQFQTVASERSSHQIWLRAGGGWSYLSIRLDLLLDLCNSSSQTRRFRLLHTEGTEGPIGHISDDDPPLLLCRNMLVSARKIGRCN